jgi:hypothetical protein
VAFATTRLRVLPQWICLSPCCSDHRPRSRVTSCFIWLLDRRLYIAAILAAVCRGAAPIWSFAGASPGARAGNISAKGFGRSCWPTRWRQPLPAGGPSAQRARPSHLLGSPDHGQDPQRLPALKTASQAFLTAGRVLLRRQHPAGAEPMTCGSGMLGTRMLALSGSIQGAGSAHSADAGQGRGSAWSICLFTSTSRPRNTPRHSHGRLPFGGFLNSNLAPRCKWRETSKPT